jgi:hypothetical protein
MVSAANHYTGGVRSGNVGESRPHLIAAANHQVVHVAHGCGVDVDQNLIRCRLRLGGLGEA